jgi:hypothetical protein
VPKGTLCTVITKLNIKIRLVSWKESLGRRIKSLYDHPLAKNAKPSVHVSFSGVVTVDTDAEIS